MDSRQDMASRIVFFCIIAAFISPAHFEPGVKSFKPRIKATRCRIKLDFTKIKMNKPKRTSSKLTKSKAEESLIYETNLDQCKTSQFGKEIANDESDKKIVSFSH